MDTGIGRQSASRVKEVTQPLPKGNGVLAVTEIASQNKKELLQKMKIIQVHACTLIQTKRLQLPAMKVNF